MLDMVISVGLFVSFVGLMITMLLGYKLYFQSKMSEHYWTPVLHVLSNKQTEVAKKYH